MALILRLSGVGRDAWMAAWQDPHNAAEWLSDSRSRPQRGTGMRLVEPFVSIPTMFSSTEKGKRTSWNPTVRSLVTTAVRGSMSIQHVPKRAEQLYCHSLEGID